MLVNMLKKIVKYALYVICGIFILGVVLEIVGWEPTEEKETAALEVSTQPKIETKTNETDTSNLPYEIDSPVPTNATPTIQPVFELVGPIVGSRRSYYANLVESPETVNNIGQNTEKEKLTLQCFTSKEGKYLEHAIIISNGKDIPEFYQDTEMSVKLRLTNEVGPQTYPAEFYKDDPSRLEILVPDSVYDEFLTSKQGYYTVYSTNALGKRSYIFNGDLNPYGSGKAAIEFLEKGCNTKLGTN